MSNFSDMLIYLRKRMGLSQQELADKIGLTRSTIGMYETAKREPDFETTEILADFFNVNMDTLLGKTKPPTPDSGDGRLQEFLTLFCQLTTEEQALIIAQIKGILSSR